MSVTQADDMAARGLMGRFDRVRLVPSADAFWFAGLLVLVVVTAVALAPISEIGFLIAGVLLLGAVAYAAYRWPRATLTAVMVTPLIDRYAIGVLLPSEQSVWVRFASELLVVVVGGVLVVGAIRTGRFVPALRTPVSVALAVFLMISAAATILNGNSLVPAAVGTIFTIDAIALFFLARMVGFSLHQMAASAAVFVSLITIAALLGIAQPLLVPDILGFHVVQGKYGESVRASSLFADPGLLGTLVGMAVGFPLMAIGRLGGRRFQVGAVVVAFLLLLALVLTFSRGSWLGLVVGFTLVALVLNRRAFIVALLLAVLAVGTTVVMPRNLLVATGDRGGGTSAPPDLGGSTADRWDDVATLNDLRSLFIQNALPILADHPLVGVGPGQFGGATARIYYPTDTYVEYNTAELFDNASDWQRTVDNFWLHILVEAGILGTLAFVAMLAYTAWRLMHAARRAIGLEFVLLAGSLSLLAVISMNGVTGMLLEGNAGAFPLWFFLGATSLLASRILGMREGAGGGGVSDESGASNPARSASAAG